MKKEINNGVICIGSNFVHSCPLKLDDDYKQVMLGLFYNDYNMHFGNFFKARNLRKQFDNIEDEIGAGRLAAEYGYVIFELKNGNSNIFLPEFFNNYQFTNTLSEIAYRNNENFSLYIDGYKDNLIDSPYNVVYDLIRKIYSDLCFDAETGFIGYSEERKAKAKKLMK